MILHFVDPRRTHRRTDHLVVAHVRDHQDHRHRVNLSSLVFRSFCRFAVPAWIMPNRSSL